MKQVLIIHGGDSFSSYEAYLSDLKTHSLDYSRLIPSKKWRDWIADNLSSVDVLRPTMPNGFNAQFDEWQIYFEKMIPYFSDDVMLVGNSLGAMFLAKYLHEKPLPQKVHRLALVAGQYGQREGSDMGSFAVDSATGLEASADEIHLFYSSDDPIVTYDSLAKFQADVPSAIAHTFTDRGHFLQETFPELLQLLQQK